MIARDIMQTKCHILSPMDTIAEAVKHFQIARPDSHLMVIADIMIKKHIRRLPVVDDQEVVGIVYVSDVFHHLLEKFIL